jgi:hypothetical protein
LKQGTYAFDAEVWQAQGKGGWHLVTLPEDVARAIRFHRPQARGFMPIAVTAQIGKTFWRSAVFPDSKSSSFLLAIKAEVRKKEDLKAGDVVRVKVSLAD